MPPASTVQPAASTEHVRLTSGSLPHTGIGVGAGVGPWGGA
eukprot:CAMPEP_0179138788 /NCGR_PEP_ID=MMETSP0796-20121207/66314_1 /TAXON_ID=73915 /ORGANISM="Pyrodinium bahamense, Strain pbaha01" /LENGTH=40 /DNA_ID= /DNA_START= /DNA_END= /DNA_ORIENTATION=